MQAADEGAFPWGKRPMNQPSVCQLARKYVDGSLRSSSNEVAELLLRSGHVLISMQKGLQFAGVALMLNERLRLEQLCRGSLDTRRFVRSDLRATSAPMTRAATRVAERVHVAIACCLGQDKP